MKRIILGLWIGLAWAPVAWAQTNPYAGLWVGSASIDAVSEPRSSQPATPTPTPTPFEMRLLVHVADNGAASLLNEVTIMEEPAAMGTNAAGEIVVARPARQVLVTDPALLDDFEGVGSRDGVAMGRRMSSAFFEFPNQRQLSLSGTFSPSGTLAGSISIPADYRTNPFKHKYHPDHDNLNATFTGYAAEAYDVTRALSFTFSPTNPAGATPPDYGYSTLGGRYAETIGGLHKSNVTVGGTFSLTRINRVGALNQ